MDEKNLTALAEAVLGRICIPLEASARHVHLNEAQIQELFGHSLTPLRPLSQPGQFLARERVMLQGAKGKFHNVAVLGPARKTAQLFCFFSERKQKRELIKYFVKNV